MYLFWSIGQSPYCDVDRPHPKPHLMMCIVPIGVKDLKISSAYLLAEVAFPKITRVSRTLAGFDS